ncbi:neprilysin-1-like isoform X2 [Liolophura sinensis]|uniref:neprilysin-1-like isoform X2 n=1 Tax=Liolophura sinensis TaxID=3198878 RepID=UPI003158231E
MKSLRIALVVIFVLSSVFQTEQAIVKRESGSAPVCHTEGCGKVAERVQSSLNIDADPCEDFYEYACGGWMTNNPIPETWSYIDNWAKLRGEVSEQIEELIGQPIVPEDVEAVKKLKTFYSSCMNEALQNLRGKEPMEDLFQKIGRWPLLEEDWNDDDFDLIDLLLKIRHYDRKYLLAVEVGADLKDPSSRIIAIDQPTLGMGRNKFLGSHSVTAIPAFKKYAHDVAKALEAQKEETLNNDIDELASFAQEVASLTAPQSQRRYIHQVYNKMTIGELYTNVSDKFDWLRYIRGVVSTPEVGIEVDESEPVMVLATDYLTKVMDLIEVTPKRILANYVMWILVKSSATKLSYDFRLLSLEYSKALSGISVLSPRSDKCMSMIKHMGDIVGRLFVNTYFDETSKKITKDMTSNLRNAFKNMLVDIDWMDEETRTAAREKADAMDLNIGYSDDLLDDNKLNAEFAELQYDPSKFFENTFAGDVYVSTKYLRLLRTPVDKEVWTTEATTVNSYYNSLKNQITFPAGILQPPFFSKEYPKSLNFGGIGMLIGHEITHGFDDKGRQFDKDGNYVQWWSDDAVVNFQNRSACIIDQYGQYFVPEANMTLDGFKTHGENIADNGGIRQAYKAYHDWLNEGLEDDPVLPNLEFNREQLFFVGFAQIMCQNLSPTAAVNRVLKSYHSPGRFRVMGALRNFEAFSTAFNCAESSYMNAQHTCRLW